MNKTFKVFNKLNYPVILLTFLFGFFYIQSQPAEKIIVIKSPNPNNLDTIYTDNHDEKVKYKYKQKFVKCD